MQFGAQSKELLEATSLGRLSMKQSGLAFNPNQMTWREFNQEVIRMGLYRDPEAQYLIEERLGMLREDGQITSEDLEITLNQLRKYKNESKTDL